MASDLAPQINVMSVGETRNCAVSFVGKLDSGETLSSSTTLGVAASTRFTSSPSTATALTYSNTTINSSAISVNGSTVAASQAVTFAVTGGEAGALYYARARCATSASQIVVGITRIKVE